jgi:hypothetical protein
MIFRIDLLRGEGIPTKRGLRGLAIASVTFVVPVIIALVMLDGYLHNRIIMSIQKREMANYEKKIYELSDVVELYKSFEKEKDIINNCLLEVSSSIGRHTQWSPILATVVKNMPDSVALTGLEVKQYFVTRKSAEVTNITIPVKQLQMNVRTDSRRDGDRAVRDFQERLRFSSLLGPKLEDIRVSQKADILDGQNIVSYKIDCIFKPEL